MVDARANFFVGEELSLVELAEPRLHLLAEPGVMVKVVLYELPDIFFCTAIIFRGDVGQLGLEFRTEIQFHETSLGPEIISVKSLELELKHGR